MSRSNNVDVKNPSTKFFEFKADSGKLQYYDKETKLNVEVPYPFVFIVLDELVTIKGYHKEFETGIYSNEINSKNTKHPVKGILTAHCFSKPGKKVNFKITGLWEQIKTDIEKEGGHFTKSVYIGIKDDKGKLQIANIHFKTTALSAWFEAVKRFDIYKKAVVITGTIDAAKGATKYKIPIFDAKEISAETNQSALNLDKELQDYLTKYFNRGNEVESSDEVAQIDNSIPEDFNEDPTGHEVVDSDDMPF